jgi:hypothetical protein
LQLGNGQLADRRVFEVQEEEPRFYSALHHEISLNPIKEVGGDGLQLLNGPLLLDKALDVDDNYGLVAMLASSRDVEGPRA